MGFASACLGIPPAAYWQLTPLEFHAASDFWIKRNYTPEAMAEMGVREEGGKAPAIKVTSLGFASKWGDEALVGRAMELLEETH